MAKEYNIGDRLYLPVWVTEKETNVMMGPDKSTTITDAKFSYTYCLGRVNTGKVRYGEEGLLLTAEEIYASRRMVDEVEHLTDMLDYGRKKYDEIEELKARNAELEALLKEVMATRDEAIKQNDELIAENKKLKAENEEWQKTARCYSDNAYSDLELTRKLRAEINGLKAERDRLAKENSELMAAADKLKDTLVDRTNDVQHLAEENDKLKTDLEQRNKDFWAMKKDRDELDSIGGKLRAENDNLKEWYEEANRTATEAAEANEELKAKIADLRNRVGEQLAQIQDLNAEVHFHKEFGEGLDKQQKELQARYDELDSVNKEQAEKIRKLDKALADLKQRNDKLQDENTNLTFLLEDAPEKEVTKPLHVVLNDGTEIEFRRYTAYDYRTDINMFVVKDGEKYIAGFLRGDKPMNLAYWWTE